MGLLRKQLTLHMALLRSFYRCGNRCYKHDAPTELAASEPFSAQSLEPELQTDPFSRHFPAMIRSRRLLNSSNDSPLSSMLSQPL